MRLFITMVITFLIIILNSCSTLILKPADFAWPIESVIKVDEKGKISDARYSFSVNVRELLKNEYVSENKEEITLRVIRDYKGYYFITGKGFKFIYVFEQSEDTFDLSNKFNIPGLDSYTNPAFNQRSPFIEFIDKDEKYMLNNEGVVK